MMAERTAREEILYKKKFMSEEDFVKYGYDDPSNWPDPETPNEIVMDLVEGKEFTISFPDRSEFERFRGALSKAKQRYEEQMQDYSETLSSRCQDRLTNTYVFKLVPKREPVKFTIQSVETRDG
jgi:hypothetical protein